MIACMGEPLLDTGIEFVELMDGRDEERTKSYAANILYNSYSKIDLYYCGEKLLHVHRQWR